MKKNKYRPGRKVKTIGELGLRIQRGQYTYFHHKPQHPGFLCGMSFRTLLSAVQRGWLRRAERA